MMHRKPNTNGQYTTFEDAMKFAKEMDNASVLYHEDDEYYYVVSASSVSRNIDSVWSRVRGHVINGQVYDLMLMHDTE